MCHTDKLSMEELEGKADASVVACTLPGFCHTTGAASLWRLAAAHDKEEILKPWETETTQNLFSTFL